MPRLRLPFLHLSAASKLQRNVLAENVWPDHLWPVGKQRLRADRLHLVPVMLDVEFCRFCCVVCRVVQMSLGRVSVMRGCLVIAAFVVPGGFAMMLGRLFVVFCRFMVMLRRML
jgi:hypothetical protein